MPSQANPAIQDAGGDPLDPQETRRLVDERARALEGARAPAFSKKAHREIFRLTRGVAAEIDDVVAGAIDAARAAGATVVSVAHVTAAAKRRHPSRSQPEPPAAGEEVVAAPSAPVPDESNVAASADRPIASSNVTGEPGSGAEPPCRRKESDDPRVRDWVARFIGPDEPPFGELLKAPPPAAGGGWDLASLDFLPEVTEEADVPPPRRRPSPPPRSRRTPRNGRRPSGERMVVPLLAGLLVVTTASTLALLSREWFHRGPRDRRSLAHAVAVSPPRTMPVTRNAARRPATTAKQSVEPLPAAAAPSPANALPLPVSDPSPAPPTAEPAVPVTSSNASRYGLHVGTYLDRDDAETERARIVADSGLEGWLNEGSGDDAGSWHVVLGFFRSRERAEAAATRLLDRGTVSQATVVSLPARGAQP